MVSFKLKSQLFGSFRYLILGAFCLFMDISKAETANRVDRVNVLVWDEQQPKQKEAYDNFLGNAIAEYLKQITLEF